MVNGWTGKKILFTHNTTRYLLLHYRELMASFVHRGAQVVVCAPFDDTVAGIRQMGIRCVDLKLARQGLNPIAELISMFNLYRVIARERPDVVFNFSIKPVIYGALAARLAGAGNIYSMITGLGHLFMEESTKYKLIRSIVSPLYRLALRWNTAVFFQNPDDKQLFVDLGLIDGAKGHAINGTGIDLEQFRPVADAPVAGTFILVSRLLWSKGIEEYVNAARLLKKKYPAAEFQLLGPFDDNPASIHASDIDKWQQEGVIRYLGVADDVRPYLARASVFVLPTNYREGRPRAILEAMSCGKPVITTDTPGCRQTVNHGENGLLVRTEDVDALAGAMEQFLVNQDAVRKMGLRSRELAEEHYDVSRVNDSILAIMTEAPTA